MDNLGARLLDERLGLGRLIDERRPIRDPTGEERPLITPSLMFVGALCGKAEEASNLHTTVRNFAFFPKGISSTPI